MSITNKNKATDNSPIQNLSIEELQKKIQSLEEEKRNLNTKVLKLTESEDNARKYKFIANAAKDFMTLINRDYLYEAVNNSYCNEHQKLPEELIGVSVEELWGKESFQSMIKPCLDDCFDGKEIHYQEWFSFSNTDDGYYDVAYYPFYGEKDKITHVAVITRNITSLKRTEIALRESKEMYRGIAEGSFDAIFTLNTRGKFNYISKASERICGFTPEEMLERNFSGFFKDTQYHQVMDAMKKMISGERIEAFQLEMKNKNSGISFVEINALPIYKDGKIIGSQGIIRDLTERKRMEERERELEVELLKEQRLASIGLLSSGIAHNIRNPLTTIYGAVEMVKNQDVNPRAIQILKKSADRICNIVDTMMTKCRKEQEVKKNPVNLSELLSSELNFMEADAYFKHQITKDFSFHEPLPCIEGVYSDFSQGLLNIIRNALDAMYRSENKTLEVKTFLEDKTINVEIADTGHGISEEDINKLFNPFYTTKPSRTEAKTNEPEGTGLGLFSSYKLLKPYGAKFDVTSKIGKGTRFKISFPMKE